MITPDASSAPDIPGVDIHSVLGRGSSATVYRGLQRGTGRVVAVKVLTGGMSDERAIARFRAEARTMATLSWHPRVAEVHEAGTTAAGEPYLVMEFLEGASLADQLRQHGPMQWTDVAAIGVQVADALAAAHAARVVHRDVKPANVLADGRGSVKLGDFGIALVEGGTHTDGRSLFGTLPYQAPEQVLAGEPASPAGDVYSLGATLFALLSGSPAHVQEGDAGAGAFLTRLASDDLSMPDRTGAPPHLLSAIADAMSRAPEARPTAVRLRDRLCRVQGESGIAITPVFTPVAGGEDATVETLAGAGSDRPKRRKRLAALAAGGTLAALAAAAGAAIAFEGGPSGSTGPGSSPTPTLAASATVSASPTVDPRDVPALSLLPDSLTGAKVEADGLWTLEGSSATRHDPVTLLANQVVKTGATAEEVEIAGLRPWLRIGPNLVPVDPTTGALGASVALDLDEGSWELSGSSSSLWIADSEGRVVRIDAGTARIAAQVELPVSEADLAAGVDRSSLLVDIAAVGDELVVFSTPASRADTPPAILRIAADGRVLGRRTLTPGRALLSVAGDDVWLSYRDGTVDLLDRETLKERATLTVGGDPSVGAATASGVWFANSSYGEVAFIETETMSVTRRIPVGRDPYSVEMSQELLFVRDTGRLLRVNPEQT